jgi:acyl-CoA thioesterase
MGGVIFTLADLAFAALSNNIHKPTVAQQVSINYLAAPKGKTLMAKADIIKSGRSSTIIQVTVTDESGQKVAIFTGTGFKL